MKTLKELNQKCKLLCEHKQHGFIINVLNKCIMMNGNANICKLFTDNNGTYYIYKRITNSSILVYTNYSDALDRYLNFIKNTCTE